MANEYEVTITPVTPAAGMQRREVMRVDADNKAEAIQKARAAIRNGGWTRHDGKLRFDAQLADE